MSQQLEICIIDDHKLFGTALKLLITSELDLDESKVHYFSEAKKGHQFIKKNPKALVLLDLNMPDKNGMDWIDDFQKINPNIQILIVSAYNQAKLVKECMQKGCFGFIHKENSFDELIAALQAIQKNETYLGQGVKLFDTGKKGDKKSQFDMEKDAFFLTNKLTKREKEILDLIVEAKTNKQIALELFISDQTVGVHRKNIMRKLGVNNTASLIKKALELQMKDY